jgi:5-methylcytosine-specific restriction endonuclease McrA
MKASTKARLYGAASLTPEELAEVRAINKRARDRRRDKRREYDAAYYAENKARVVARAVAWRKDRRRDWAIKANRTAARFGVSGTVDWRDLVAADCAYCGTPCESWDHVMPLSRGGSHTMDNIVPCCWPCNTEKKHRTPEEWFAGEKWEQPRRRRPAPTTPG